ncbi:MAG TPA: alanine--glyoxylate aminotransferase family protein [bacterium]|nr:alanine--glyoxylate aminotransferase family protein [bacterium]
MKIRLLTPGPTPVSPEVAAAMAQPMPYHRAAAFKEVVLRSRENLKWLFQTTKGETLFLTCSGSGAMEGALVNTLSRGDTIIVVRGGKFGERWSNIAKAYGVEAVNIDVEWGKAVAVDAVKKALEQHPKAKAVCVQASETSTGVGHPVKAIADLVKGRPDTLMIVDAISALGVMPLPFDEWQIDVMVAGSQKALMLPPGLAFVALSAKAQEAMKKSDLPKFYFSFAKELASQQKGETAWTPAISLVLGLDVALAQMKAEGYEKIVARHHRLAEATRAGAKAMGLELLAPESPSDACTAIKAPNGIDGQAVVKEMRDRHGIIIAGGQDQLKGKIFRLSHMGYVDRFDILTALAASGDVLKRLGAKVDVEKGLAAAEAVFNQG